MFTFLLVILLLLFYILVLHFRWEHKKKELVTSLRDEEAKLIHMEKMASVGTLAAGIAHEINNPLTFLIVNLEALLKHYKESDRTDESRQIVDECLDGTKRIKRIVEDLLSFSHRGRGEKTLVDINKLLDFTLRIVWNEIKYKVDLVKDYRIVKGLWADPTQISQVIINLVINAYQAIKDKGVITISTYEDDINVYIKISDTGIGMPKEITSKIFEPFFTTKGGTGLGLAVSNEIIENYGGHIRVESKVGEGTRCTVVIPKDEQAKMRI